MKPGRTYFVIKGVSFDVEAALADLQDSIGKACLDFEVELIGGVSVVRHGSQWFALQATSIKRLDK